MTNTAEKELPEGKFSFILGVEVELPPFDQFGSKTQIRRGIFGSVLVRNDRQLSLLVS